MYSLSAPPAQALSRVVSQVTAVPLGAPSPPRVCLGLLVHGARDRHANELARQEFLVNGPQRAPFSQESVRKDATDLVFSGGGC